MGSAKAILDDTKGSERYTEVGRISASATRPAGRRRQRQRSRRTDVTTAMLTTPRRTTCAVLSLLRRGGKGALSPVRGIFPARQPVQSAPTFALHILLRAPVLWASPRPQARPTPTLTARRASRGMPRARCGVDRNRGRLASNRGFGENAG